MNGLVEKIVEWDVNLFFLINSWRSVFFDEFMWQVSHFWIWLPLYGVMAFSLIKRLGAVGLVVLALTIFICDQTSSLFKESTQRPRPSHRFDIPIVRGYKGGQFGFFSGHATNSFGVAAFFVFAFGGYWNLLWLWAALVAYSRVYLGVHYPSDVLAGAWIGTLFGFLSFRYLMPYAFKLVQKLR